MAAIFAAGACAGDSATEDAASPGAPAASGDVEVLSTGTGAKRELRFDVQKGHTETASMRSAVDIDIAVDGQAGPSAPVPAMRAPMEVVVDDVASNGDITYSYTFTKMEAEPTDGVTPEMLATMQQTLAQMAGVKGRAVVSARGVTKQNSIETASISNASLRSTLDSLSSQVAGMSVPFPETKVGVGASWRAKRTASLNGLQTDTTTTYKLVKLTGDMVHLEIEQTATSPKGPAALPNLPQGTTVEIDESVIRSAGTMQARLSRLLPVQATMTGSGDVKMTMRSGTERAALVQHMTMESSITGS